MTDHPVTQIRDPYDWYFAALDGEELEVFPRTPECGFYRMLDRDGYWTAIAIWINEHSGKLQVMQARPQGPARMTDDLEEVIETFGLCWKHPVKEDVWRAVVEQGEPWPDAPADRPPSNLSADPREEILYQLKGEQEELERFLKNGIHTQEEADRAANWKSRIEELGKRAYELKRKAKKPHEERAKEEELRWTPLVILASNMKDAIENALRPFFRAERERKERERQEAIEAGAAVELKPVKVRAGTVGRTVAPVSVKYADIIDHKTLAVWLVEQNNPDMLEVLQIIANRQVRAGTCPPGCIVKTEEKAR